MIEPQPGEVWVITEPKYGRQEYDVIYHNGPFIVTYVTARSIGYVSAGDGVEPLVRYYPRYQWDWGKHAARICPPIPSWPELGHESAPEPDSLSVKT